MTDKELIYLSAVRYVLMRTTYIVDQTVNFMLKQKLSKQCKKIMIRDIEYRSTLEHGSDKEAWDKLLVYLKK